MKTRMLWMSAVLILAAMPSWASSKVSVEYKSGQVEIKGTGTFTFEKQENAEDKQIILDIKGAQLAASSKRKLDTSSIPGPVALISPYQVEGQPDTVRVVIQLREAAQPTVAQDGNKLSLKFGGDAVAESSQPAIDAPPAAPAAEAGAAAAANAATPASSAPADTASAATPASASGGTDLAGGDPQKKIDEFLTNRESKKYIGKSMILNLRDADITDVLRMVGEVSGFNMVIGEQVRGALTLSLGEVPWDQALDIVLKTMKLGAERSGNVLRIDTLANLTAEKQAEAQARAAAEVAAPKITKVFPISYAKPGELSNLLSAFASSGNKVGGKVEDTVTIKVDDRTNQIVVQATTEAMERVKKIIELLDTQTPQVLIEAKVVEMNEGFSKSVSGSIGFGTQNYFASFAGGDPTKQLTGSAGAANQGLFGFSPKVSFLPGMQRLNALFSIAEDDNQAKVVTSPRLVVLNKQSATINQSSPISVPVITVSNGVTQTTNQTISANTNLNVTPTVTNDGNVILDISVTRDVPQADSKTPTVAGRTMHTQVVVASGSTLVIGGVYTVDTTTASSGVPILRKIPIVGALFGSKSDANKRSELFFFVTPRILNSREAGLNSG